MVSRDPHVAHASLQATVHGEADMATTHANHSANTIGAMAAGKLLARATGGRWGPAILILAGIVLLRRGAAARADRKARQDATGHPVD